MTKKTKFGVNQLTNPTPQSAKWIFRIIFLITSVGTFMITDYPGMSDITKLLVLKWFTGANMFFYGLSKMFGVEDVSPYEFKSKETS